MSPLGHVLALLAVLLLAITIIAAAAVGRSWQPPDDPDSWS